MFSDGANSCGITDVCSRKRGPGVKLECGNNHKDNKRAHKYREERRTNVWAEGSAADVLHVLWAHASCPTSGWSCSAPLRPAGADRPGCCSEPQVGHRHGDITEEPVDEGVLGRHPLVWVVIQHLLEETRTNRFLFPIHL